ncbi:FAD-dependent monooxygenase [Thalassotalea sp. LPB0316]|uniref:FAD-dependent oxidoreductase n=1 Tax=Thalassotalea sp. LPB0316 TaxID=2769490 RepID=UPI0018673E84|nr:FAD-dependent oxidoreductase [Thalassotalea sp. LPB0316]QOL24508.1 FAD-dependent monooxygenase [Thalassotalea sp. LPB0316]
MTTYDCAIVGGGMIGAATAVALADLGLKIALIERFQPAAFEVNGTEPFDLRISAISLNSQQLLETLGAWPYIDQSRICQYKRLGVWEDDFAYTEFNAQEIGRAHLGYMMENRQIQLALWQVIQQHASISLLAPEQVKQFTNKADQVTIELGEQNITAKLLIAADGANSQIRQLANIGVTGWDYAQSAMLINVATSIEQQDITWQKFYPTGPVAFLPMPGNNASLVWYHNKAEINRLAALSNEQLAVEIANSFPEKLGEVNVLGKGAFNLTRRHANHYVSGRVVLLGDAAHTINPLAGQGVNLGFKDVKALQMAMAKAIGEGKAFDDPATLASYERARRSDNLMMMSGMDAIYQTFTHQSPVVKFVRNLGLFAAQRAGKLKSKALAYACGV